jgi:DNA-binding transcriptional regulator YiaG
MGLIRSEVRRIVDRRQKLPRRVERRLAALELKVRSLSTALRAAARRRGPVAGAAPSGAPTGTALRALRERLGLTRQKLAKRLQVSPSIIFLWESGRSTPSRKANLEALRKFFDSAGSASSPSAATAMSGPEIRAVRDRLGLSREKFAKRAGVSPSMIFLWESGRSAPRRRANIDKLQRLASEAGAGGGRARGRGRRATARRRR